MTEAEHAAKNVQMYYFAMIDSALFLNSHPDDSAALQYFHKMHHAYDDAKAAYEKHFGPLTITGTSEKRWNWIGSPWPWEGVK